MNPGWQSLELLVDQNFLTNLFFVLVGYTSRDVIYTWNNDRQVAIADDMKLSQFDLIATPAANQTDSILTSDPKAGPGSTTPLFVCKL